MKSKVRHLVIASALTILQPHYALTSEETLYADPIPDDAIFIRWISPEDTAYAFGSKFDAELAATGNYLPVSAKTLKDVTVGGYYSVYSSEVIPEPPRNDATKVHLLLLNVSNDPARLVVTDNGAEVIGVTPVATAKSRAVNPIEIGLSVIVDGQGQTDFHANLRRGQNLTFLVSDEGTRLIENGFTEVVEPK